MNYYISNLSMLCANGVSNDEIMKNLSFANSAIKEYNGYMVGKINNLKRDEIFNKLEKCFDTRTNHILYEALKKAGIEEIINKYGKENIAVIVGNTTSGVEENLNRIKAEGSDFLKDKKEVEFFISMNSLSNPALFVKNLYGLENLAYSISTACTSGIKTLLEGINLLNNGLCKAVICAGVDSINTLTLKGFDSLDILSSEHIKPFSDDRAGTNLAEGACVFVLSDEKIKDSIKVLSALSNNDAFHITKPNTNCELQKELISCALKEAGLKSVDYVNLHGTGTISNDEMETALVSEFFDGVSVSSTKSLMGHTLGACGALELGICCELILRSKNGKCLLPAQPNFINNKKLNIVKPGDKKVVKTALSTSFAFGGDNAVVVLGDSDE